MFPIIRIRMVWLKIEEVKMAADFDIHDLSPRTNIYRRAMRFLTRNKRKEEYHFKSCREFKKLFLCHQILIYTKLQRFRAISKEKIFLLTIFCLNLFFSYTAVRATFKQKSNQET